MTKRKVKVKAPKAKATPPEATETALAASETPPPSWWTLEREKCLERILAGWTKKQIATDLGVHPNTISNWCAHAEFTARVQEQRADKEATIRQRRIHETNVFTDRAAKLAMTALDRAEKYPNDYHSRQAARDWLAEYKQFRAEERVDMGDNVQRFAHQVTGAVGHVHSHTLSQSSFRGFLEGVVDGGIIDTTAIETTDDVHKLITQVTQQALLDSTLLDDLAEEERNLDIEPALAQAERK